MSLGIPHLVREKSHHSRLSISAHRGTLSCIEVQAQGYGLAPRVFTAGEDGALRIWEGRGLSLIVETSSLTRHRISCMSVSGKKVFLGTSGGEVIITRSDGTPVSRFSPHKGVVTCLQVVNRGRIFTGSTDGSVKFIGEDGEAIRQFPLNPKDSEPILSVKAISANLIFTGSDQGVIRIYNLRQELLRELRTAALRGVPLNLMEVVHVNDKVSIICAHKTRLTMWYLTLHKDSFGEYEIVVDAVKSISSRMPNGRITAIKAVFVNPLRTNRPCVYLGNSNGLVQIIVPTGKFGTLTDQHYRKVMAPKFKQYTFKDVAGTVSHVCAGGGRIYAGTTRGTLYMWKECLAMLNLRKWSLGRPDTHGYRSRTPNRQSVSVLLEESQDEDEPVPDAESLRAFAKVADSDISENEFENDFSSGPVLVSLNESISEHQGSRRSQRASTVGQESFSSSPLRSSSNLGLMQSNAPNMQRLSSQSSIQRQSHVPGSSATFTRDTANISAMNSNPSLTSSHKETPVASPMSSVSLSPLEQQIIQLLHDSAAELANLPEIYSSNPPPYNPTDFRSAQAMQSSSIPSQFPSATNRQSQPQMAPISQFTASPTPIPQFNQTQVQPQTKPPQTAPQSEEDQRCVVCLDAKRDSILYQCGHVCVCNPCGKELISRKLTCPMCRAPIKDCIILYR